MPTPTRHFIGTSDATPELIVRWCQQQWPTHLPEGLLFCVPTEIPAEMDAETLHAYLLRDKKKAVGKVRFALPFAVGDVKTGIIIPEQDLHDLLERKQL